MIDYMTEFYQKRGVDHVWWQSIFFFFGGLLLMSPAVEVSLLAGVSKFVHLLGWIGVTAAPVSLVAAYWLKGRKLPIQE